MKVKRVTVEVDEQTHHALKVKATEQGTTISKIIRAFIASQVGSKPKGNTDHTTAARKSNN